MKKIKSIRLSLKLSMEICWYHWWENRWVCLIISSTNRQIHFRRTTLKLFNWVVRNKLEKQTQDIVGSCRKETEGIGNIYLKKTKYLWAQILRFTLILY